MVLERTHVLIDPAFGHAQLDRYDLDWHAPVQPLEHGGDRVVGDIGEGQSHEALLA